MSDITIRPITPADETEWRRLWTAYLTFYHTSVPEQVYASSFARLLGDAAQDFNGLIAEIDGKPCGLVHYLFHRHMWKLEKTVYLQDLYADPKVRGTGVGRALIEAVYDAADTAGCPSVYWLTQQDNSVARRLYDRVGKLDPFLRYSRR